MINKTNCYACKHMTRSGFCGNKLAVKERGTYMPEAKSCSYWEAEPYFTTPLKIENGKSLDTSR